MPEYLVTWKIELEADTPGEAAFLALQTQRDPESTATVFEVERMDEDGTQLVVVDLQTEDGVPEVREVGR